MYRKELAVIYPITDIQARQLEGGEISLPVTHVSLSRPVAGGGAGGARDPPKFSDLT